MDLKEQILEAIKNAENGLKPHGAIRDEAIRKFNEVRQELELPVKELIKEYLDFELKDANGASVREGYVISTPKGYPVYKVMDRGMQSLFGIPLWNPRVIVLTYDITEKAVKGKRQKEFCKSELSEMVIVFDANMVKELENSK